MELDSVILESHLNNTLYCGVQLEKLWSFGLEPAYIQKHNSDWIDKHSKVTRANPGILPGCENNISDQTILNSSYPLELALIKGY